MSTSLGLRRKTWLLPIVLISAGAAPAQKCSDVPLRFTFQQTAILMNLDGSVGAGTVGTAIVGDGNDVYANGSSVLATIKFCAGTYDAVLNLSVSKRKLTLKLLGALNGTNPPAPGTYTRNGVFNVLNVLCKATGEGAGCVNPGQPFVTRAVFGLEDMVGRDGYGLRYLPVANPSTLPMAPYTPNVSSQVLRPDQNSPLVTSPVLVMPLEYNCGQGRYPSWIVRGTLENSVGTLFNIATNTAAGQYSAPFEVRIESLKCFDPGY